MAIKLIISIWALAAYFAESATPKPQPIRCGEMPPQIFPCIGSPKILTLPVLAKCIASSECKRNKCFFTEFGWMDGSNINKTKVIAHFNQFAVDYPAWTPAVTHLKTACLGQHDLRAQGAYFNCPAYDIMHCVLASFLKNATPSQWKTTEECRYPRSYAASCPICPTSCFGQHIPYGSCNACLSRST